MLLRDMPGRSCRKGSLWDRDRLWMPLLGYVCMCVCDIDGTIEGMMQYVHVYAVWRKEHLNQPPRSTIRKGRDDVKHVIAGLD